MAGRRPLPSHLKLLRGTPGKRKPLPKEPKPARGIPDPPKHLTKDGREAWSLLAPILDQQMHVLTVADGLALELVVEAYADYLATTRGLMALTSRTYENAEGMIRSHPLVGQRADAWRRVRLALGEFGLTPSSRAKVHGEPEEKDPLQEFLKSG